MLLELSREQNLTKWCFPTFSVKNIQLFIVGAASNGILCSMAPRGWYLSDGIIIIGSIYIHWICLSEDDIFQAVCEFCP